MATQNGNNVNGNGVVHYDDMAALSAALTGGIVNPQTGQGMPYDDPSRSAVAVYGGRLDRESLNITFEKYGLLRKVVCNIPRAATYRWGEPTIAKGSNSKLDELVAAINTLPIETSLHTYTGVKKGFLEAMKAAFLTGNAGLVLQVDDGLMLDQELDLKKVRSLKGLWLMNRWQLVPDLQSFTLFKKTSHFRVQDGQQLGEGYQGQNRIHRSRVLWFRGSEAVDDYESNRHQGCDASILEPLMESFNLFLAGVKGAGRMIADFDFYVHAIDGLLAKLEANPVKAQAAIAARMAINRQRRSINRDMVIDKEHEAITNVSRTVAGYSDLLQHCKDFLLASADYPAELLYGEFPTGLNAPSTESGSRQTWNDTIAQAQEDKLSDNIIRLNKVICAAKDGPTQGQEIKGLGWKWHVLYESSPEENATLQNTFATMVSTLNGIDPRVAMAMIVSGWGGERFSQEINFPPELVKALEEKIKQDPSQQPEPDTSALQGGDQPPADAPPDGNQPPEDEQAQQDQSIADDILRDRTLLDSADARLDDATPAKRIVHWHGFKLGLQYQPFDKRHGKVLPVAYGHIRNTKGADGMACDCYVGSNLESDRVFEITQLVDGQFDEHKYMLGFDSMDDARATFLKVMPATMFGGIQEVGLTGLNAYRLDSDVHLDASRPELIAKATEKNKGLPTGKKFKTFGATNAAIAEFVGEGIAQPATTAKTAAKPKGGTKGGKYQTSKTSSAIATAIAKKTGADPEAIEKDLRGKIQKAIDKTRREAKKAGKEPTDKELRAAARVVVQKEATSAIASARGEGKPQEKPKEEKGNGSKVSGRTAKTGTESGSSTGSDEKAQKSEAKSAKTVAASVAPKAEITDRAEFNTAFKAWQPDIKTVDLHAGIATHRKDVDLLQSRIDKTKAAPSDGKIRIQQISKNGLPESLSLSNTEAVSLFEKQKAEAQKRIAKLQQQAPKKAIADDARLVAASSIYTDLKDSLKDKRNQAGGIKGADGEMKAAYTYRQEKDHIYLDYLVTSPHNLLEGSGSTKGAGTQAVANIIQKSIEAGKGGKVKLMALEDAMRFYKKIGFEHEGGEEGNEHMTLSPEAAKTFLEKIGHPSTTSAKAAGEKQAKPPKAEKADKPEVAAKPEKKARSAQPKAPAPVAEKPAAEKVTRSAKAKQVEAKQVEEKPIEAEKAATKATVQSGKQGYEQLAKTLSPTNVYLRKLAIAQDKGEFAIDRAKVDDYITKSIERESLSPEGLERDKAFQKKKTAAAKELSPSLSDTEAAALGFYLNGQSYDAQNRVLRNDPTIRQTEGGAKYLDYGKEGRLPIKNLDAYSDAYREHYVKPLQGISETNIATVAALSKLPSVTHGQLSQDIKGLKEDDPLKRYIDIKDMGSFLEKYKPGNEIVERAFTSTTAQQKPPRSEASVFADAANVEMRIAYKKQNSAAKYVDHIHKQAENVAYGEVLFPPMTKFRVKSVIPPKNKRGKHIIEMEEI